MRRVLFATGAPRSGTTLLDKLLAQHPAISMLSQPFPLLLVDAKREQLRQGGRERRYPLDPSPDDVPQAEPLGAFLERFRPSRAWLEDVLARLADYSGQYTRFSRGAVRVALDELPVDPTITEVLEHLYRKLGPRPGAPWVGAKETFCEEFLPHFLAQGWRCVLLVRDVRDVVASLHHGRGAAFVGARKPILFEARSWRKSVAHLLHLESHPRFTWLRFEDLVTNPADTLARVTRLLGLEELPRSAWSGEVRDQRGEVWESNSSHAVVSRLDGSAVGSHRRVLPGTVRGYLEATCGPELACLGYAVDLDLARAERVIAELTEDDEPARPELAGYSTSPKHVAQELDRLAELRSRRATGSPAHFHFPGVRDRLRAVLPP